MLSNTDFTTAAFVDMGSLIGFILSGQYSKLLIIICVIDPIPLLASASHLLQTKKCKRNMKFYKYILHAFLT